MNPAFSLVIKDPVLAELPQSIKWCEEVADRIYMEMGLEKELLGLEAKCNTASMIRLLLGIDS